MEVKLNEPKSRCYKHFERRTLQKAASFHYRESNFTNNRNDITFPEKLFYYIGLNRLLTTTTRVEAINFQDRNN